MNIFFLTIMGLFAHSEYPLHILPDAPGIVYQEIQKAQKSDLLNASPTIEKAITAGNKNLAWLKYMNEVRAADEQIALTKPGELTSYPIEKPSTYNERIIGEKYDSILAEIPATMKKIIFENGAMTREPGLPLEEYIVWAKKVDRVYQSANRWQLTRPYIFFYRQNAYKDIRGYYFLGKEENLNDKLNQFSSLPAETQTTFKNYLLNMCSNSRANISTCKSRLTNAISKNKVFAYYQEYLPSSQKIWNDNFLLTPYRKDITWNSQQPDIATVPVRHTTPQIEEFLRVNIEDEWKWENWNLRLNFTNNAAIHVKFEPNVTPHVTGYDTIVMDANTPLTEWDVMWTIRHEFGHSLGFPDCYIEFYDDVAEEMVNYQLDVTNLMCSRAGVLQQTHFDEMKKAYFR